jgi:hypothetical protein
MQVRGVGARGQGSKGWDGVGPCGVWYETLAVPEQQSILSNLRAADMGNGGDYVRGNCGGC